MIMFEAIKQTIATLKADTRVRVLIAHSEVGD